MADKLLIIMMNSNPEEVMEIVPPISQAMVAASMEYEVEVVFTGRSAAIVKPGNAEKVCLNDNNQQTLYDLIKEANQSGVRFKVCSSAAEYWGVEVIPEIEETVGGAYIISEAMDDSTVTFTY